TMPERHFARQRRRGRQEAVGRPTRPRRSRASGAPVETGDAGADAGEGRRMNPDFSIVIPSRNRPALLRQAIDSVLAQRHLAKEIIVVDDGSDGDAVALYAKLADELAGRVTFLHLVRRPRGHGQSYAINFGAGAAAGNYIGMLDDDDYWIDPDHLGRA